MSATQYQILSLTQLKRSVRRAILGKVEHAGTRFIITDYGEAVAELGPLSESAEMFLAKAEPEDEADAPRTNGVDHHTRNDSAS